MTPQETPEEQEDLILNDQAFWDMIERNAQLSQEHLIRTLDGEEALKKFKQKQAET
ncbi:MAG: hypothetical protein Q4P66_02205 [Actinomycetaceae bacterium]|nr:hypothetical protein [Actinomycetaceae bacterium]